MSRNIRIIELEDPVRWKYPPLKGADCAVCGGPLTSWYHSHGRDICLNCIANQSARTAASSIGKKTCVEDLLPHFSPSCDVTERLGFMVCQSRIAEVMHRSETPERKALVHATALQLGERSDHPLAGFLKLRTMILLIKEPTLAFESFDEVVHEIISQKLCEDIAEFSRLSSVLLLYLSGYSKENARLLKREQQIDDHWHTQVYTTLTRSWRGFMLPRIPRSVAVEWLEACIVRYGKDKQLLSPAVLDDVLKQYIIGNLDEGFSTSELTGIYQRYIKPLIPSVHQQVPKIAHQPKTLKKSNYLDLLYQVLNHPESCSMFFDRMERFIREGFLLMVRTGQVLYVEVLTELGMTDSFIKGVSHERDIPKVFPLFKHQSPYYYRTSVLEDTIFYISRACASVFSIFLPSEQLPLTYQLPDQSWRIAQTRNAGSSITHAKEYIEHIGLSWSKNGLKVTKGSLKALGAAAKVSEPYHDITRLNTLRSSVITELLKIPVHLETTVSGNDLVQQIFDLGFSFTNMYVIRPENLLTHLKIISYEGEQYQMREHRRLERSAMQILLRSMEVDKWVTFDEIFVALADGCLLPKVFDPLQGYISVQFTALGNGYYEDRNETYGVALLNYNDVVRVPFIKCLLFLLNTLGVVDLAMTEPVNEAYHPANRDYLSVFDGVQACALTPFGAWLVGKQENSTVEVIQEAGRIHLNEHQLYAVLEGDLPVAEVVLKTMAKKSSGTLYQFTIESFLQGCDDLSDIKQKISTFEQVICQDPPELWKSFLSDLISRVSALSADNTSYITYTIGEGSSELIRILTEDAFLAEEVIKAEGFRILIPRKSYPKVRTRLRAYGYLLPILKVSSKRKPKAKR